MLVIMGKMESIGRRCQNSFWGVVNTVEYILQYEKMLVECFSMDSLRVSTEFKDSKWTRNSQA